MGQGLGLIIDANKQLPADDRIVVAVVKALD